MEPLPAPGAASADSGPRPDLENWNLSAVFGDRVLAFEHATLSKSPIENAFELADLVAHLLPSGAKLTSFPFSWRLVGELLCNPTLSNRFEPREERPPQSPMRGTCSPRQSATLPKRPEPMQTTLRDLGKLQLTLQKQRFQVARFVRVACPHLAPRWPPAGSIVGFQLSAAWRLRCPIHRSSMPSTTLEILQRPSSKSVPTRRLSRGWRP